jgi:hypothetical protein
MVGELIMLPVRVGVRATRLWFRALEETISITSSATERVIGRLASRSPNGAGEASAQERALAEVGPSPSGDEPRTSTDGGTPAPARPSRRSRRDPRSAPRPRAEPAPSAEPAVAQVHVSEEPVLVEELAEPGAEEGAGAEVHVDPPWDGYERMNAKHVISRLATAEPTELAAVQLYEASNRRRQTIMTAVERELRKANTSGSRSNQRR